MDPCQAGKALNYTRKWSLFLMLRKINFLFLTLMVEICIDLALFLQI